MLHEDAFLRKSRMGITGRIRALNDRLAPISSCCIGWPSRWLMTGVGSKRLYEVAAAGGKEDGIL